MTEQERFDHAIDSAYALYGKYSATGLPTEQDKLFAGGSLSMLLFIQLLMDDFTASDLDGEYSAFTEALKLLPTPLAAMTAEAIDTRAVE